MLLDINWGEFGIKAGQLLLSLSILIIFHEFGHYITARWFKCRVEKFYLFFDPWFALFKKKVGDTEYGIGWLPLGGYVKIAGMIDESMDKEAMKKQPQDWEFRSKPAWQRLIIMIGGVTVNVLLAFLIYAMILFVWGEKKTPMDSVKNGVWITDSLMHEIGLRNGDKILTINDRPVDYFENLNAAVLTGTHLTVERGGVQQRIDLPVNLIEKLVESKRKRGLMLMPRVPAVVGAFSPKDTTLAQRAGLLPGDKIIGVDSVTVAFFDELSPLIAQKKGASVALTVERNQELLTLTSLVSEEGKIGIGILSNEEYEKMGVLQVERKKYSLLAALPAGVNKSVEKLKFYVDQFRLILNPDTGAYKGIGGFKSMGSIFPAVWDWESFWNITAFFSIILAFMNLLPIPALDGGHVLFTLVEMITRRKPSEKFLEYAQVVGMILLFGLLIYANGNDLFGWNR
ncbi:MAG TPA: RIP metalloprotease RseP [Lacibacter sp.]|nr:RIP metalloprotease RseP [Lacibacter sp.]HMO90271.1 RIP metalloprotease RseP [Lacibacter sp.]HMP87305.1 RIP metalloprotease RseP [Lacibacter sp.]